MIEQLPYGVTIERVSGASVWRATECRHLTPEENQGGQNVFVKVFDEWGQRARGVQIAYRRGDRQPIEHAPLDKPDGPMEKGHGNIPIYPDDTINLFLLGTFDSDFVRGIHTRHDDERGPNGEIWNSRGHHSWIVTFQRQAGVVVEPEPEKPTEPQPDPDQLAEIKAQLAALTQRVTDIETHIFNSQGEP